MPAMMIGACFPVVGGIKPRLDHLVDECLRHSIRLEFSDAACSIMSLMVAHCASLLAVSFTMRATSDVRETA